MNLAAIANQLEPEPSEPTSLDEYFALPSTPSAKSPVGILMQRIVEKFPAITFAEARAKAHNLLQKAAGRFAYRLPTVYSDEELTKRFAALKTAQACNAKHAGKV